MFRIQTLNKISPDGLDMFDRKLYTYGTEMEDPDGILVRSASMHDMELPANLKAIARAGAGVNNIPVDACTEKGIVVFNTPGANANAVKELVIAGILLSSRKIVQGIEWTKTLKGNGAEVGKMVEKGKSAFAGPEITGKKLGVIGLGAIGVLVANTARKLGMDVYGYDPYLSVEAAWHLENAINHASSLKEIYEKCDYISIHVPLTNETKHMINAESIATMRDGVRILNFARGDLVSNEELIAALESGKVAAYVTDFPSDDLIGVDGIITIPHLGASTPESENNCAKMAAREMIDYLENGNIKNSVNLPNAEAPRTTDCRVCIIHQNVPNMIAQISGAFSEMGLNIENLINKSKKAAAYTMIDVQGADKVNVEKLNAIEGIINIRVIR
ncbi:MAG: phosphoglycerate dehydrogenase [Clostridia bacterium]|nr:phosphoglycerate dehydrogenase [Clostridia bacterium]